MQIRTVRDVEGTQVDIFDGLVYSNAGGRPQLADLYLPTGFRRPLPVVVWLHGGGWQLGDRKLGPDLARFFSACGFAMCSIDYRLSDEATFPAQIEDVKTAVRWLRSIATEYELDSEHIGLWGSSAGGHLAALAATSGGGLFETSEHGRFSSEISCIVDGYGPTDFFQLDAHRPWVKTVRDDAESARLKDLKPSVHPDSFESRLVGGPIAEQVQRVRAANPITYAREGVCPTMILHGTSDFAVPVHQSLLLFDALARFNNDVTLCLVDGFKHGFLNKNDWDKVSPSMEVRTPTGRSTGIASTKLIEDFFRKHLL